MVQAMPAEVFRPFESLATALDGADMSARHWLKSAIGLAVESLVVSLAHV